MANTFNNATFNNIGSTPEIVYQTDANTKATVIGINIANLLTQSVTVNIILEIGTGIIPSTTYIVKNVVIPAGNSLAAIGGDQKLVMTENNKIKVSASGAVTNALDVIVSVLEIT